MQDWIAESILTEVQEDFLYNTPIKNKDKTKEFKHYYNKENYGKATITLLEIMAEIQDADTEKYTLTYYSDIEQYIKSVANIIKVLNEAYSKEDMNKTNGYTINQILQKSLYWQPNPNSIVDSAELNEATLLYKKYYAILANDIPQNDLAAKWTNYQTNPIKNIK